MRCDKLIVTDCLALHRKYNGPEYIKLVELVEELITLDREERHLNTIVCDISGTFDQWTSDKWQRDGRGHHATPSEAYAKSAIDAAFDAYEPHYIEILGGIDIIPMQSLRNPEEQFVHVKDKIIPSDLPYASRHPYSSDIHHFVTPERVVSRIPDYTGVKSMHPFTAQFIHYQKPLMSSVHECNASALAFAASDFGESCQRNAFDIFGHDVHPIICPTGDVRDVLPRMRARFHFFNGHGGSGSPVWRGGDGTVALESRAFTSSDGAYAIVGSEACYGGLLYRPRFSSDMPICCRYVTNGATAFLGSTTIVSGGNDTADLAGDIMVRYFLKNVLSGYSAGRALLDARIAYLENLAPEKKGRLTTTDLITLAQFNLYGFASGHPVIPDRQY